MHQSTSVHQVEQIQSNYVNIYIISLMQAKVIKIRFFSNPTQVCFIGGTKVFQTTIVSLLMSHIFIEFH